jgi:hypothetical protein
MIWILFSDGQWTQVVALADPQAVVIVDEAVLVVYPKAGRRLTRRRAGLLGIQKQQVRTTNPPDRFLCGFWLGDLFKRI